MTIAAVFALIMRRALSHAPASEARRSRCEREDASLSGARTVIGTCCEHARFAERGLSARGNDGRGAGKILWGLHDVLLGARDRPFQQAGRPAVRQLPPWRRLRDLRRAPAGLPRLRVRMADPPRSAAAIASRTSSARSSWRTGTATNTAPSARRRGRWPGAIRASSPIWSRSPSPGGSWSPRPGSRRGGSSAQENGDRRSDWPPDNSPDCLLARRPMAVAAFLTSPQAPGSAIRDPMLLSRRPRQPGRRGREGAKRSAARRGG